MTNCQKCGNQVDLPFVCHSCGGHFCAEHRFPEAHDCYAVIKVTKRNSRRRKERSKSRKIGSCPRCHAENSQILKYNTEKIIFRCHRCSLVYGQRKSYPYYYFHVYKRNRVRKSDSTENIPIRNPELKIPESMIRKPSWLRKVAGITIALVIVLSVVYFLSNYSVSPISLPVISPVPSPIAVTGKVVGLVGSVISGNISGVEVSVINSTGSTVTTSKTNATGCFSFSDLPHGSYTIEISVPYGFVASSETTYSITSSRDLEFRLQNLLVNGKTMHYPYTLRGESSQISFTVYQGMYNYLVSIENSTVSYYAGQEPSDEETSRIVTLRYVNEGVEKGELNNLVKAIKQVTSNEDDQARIAISLVQNIPYDWNTAASSSTDWKYPYEILYSNKGVCGEKSQLLVCLLRELGFGCSILEFTSQSHAAVGIECPTQYAYYSGYAFVETTRPSIITDWHGDYVGVGKLPSSPSYVIEIQNGKVMNSISEEYQDAQTYLSLINMGPVLDEYHYSQWQSLVSKYGISTS